MGNQTSQISEVLPRLAFCVARGGGLGVVQPGKHEEGEQSNGR
jgi:hypothetical protein